VGGVVVSCWDAAFPFVGAKIERRHCRCQRRSLCRPRKRTPRPHSPRLNPNCTARHLAPSKAVNPTLHLHLRRQLLGIQRSDDEYGEIECGGLPVRSKYTGRQHYSAPYNDRVLRCRQTSVYRFRKHYSAPTAGLALSARSAK
jgi:hypothetical protein